MGFIPPCFLCSLWFSSAPTEVLPIGIPPKTFQVSGLLKSLIQQLKYLEGAQHPKASWSEGRGEAAAPRGREEQDLGEGEGQWEQPGDNL